MSVQDYVILDEGHKIKNPSTKCAKGVHSIRARNRIVLSGTPLMNNLKVPLSLIVWTFYQSDDELMNQSTFTQH